MERQDLQFCAKYPFTEKAKQVQRDYGLDDLKEGFIREAERRLAKGLDERENPQEIKKEIDSASEETLKEMIVSYPLMKIVASITEDRYVKKKAGQSESRKVRHYLEFENTKRVEKVAEEIIPFEKQGENYKIKMVDYLDKKPRRKNYKLVNTPLEGGNVYLNKENLIEVVAGHVYSSFLEKGKVKNPPEKLEDVAERIKKYKIKLMKSSNYSGRSYMGYTDRFKGKRGGKIDHSAFPPCMNKIYNELASGEDVGHQARFVLATFMINLGMNVEQMLKPYSGQENYDEEKTRYYLKHASGKEGGGTEYSAPSCSKMNTYGLCPADCNVKHPLSYYYRHRGGGKSGKQTEQQNDKQD